MRYFAGLDVAMTSSALCVVDETGTIVLETTVATTPEAIAEILAPYRKSLAKLGHETGSLAPWLHKQLTVLGWPIVCLEAAHARAALSSMRNKTDRNDARGLAHILRTGWYRSVHIGINSLCSLQYCSHSAARTTSRLSTKFLAFAACE